MTGLQCLKEEMQKRGASKALTESKAVAMVLDIVADGGSVYTDMAEAVKEYNALLDKIENTKRELARKGLELDAIIARKARETEAAAEYLEYIKEALCECETKEGRDAIKRALVFINAVDVDTKYDNTAYIIGLASILSGGRVEAMPELKKINGRLFDR